MLNDDPFMNPYEHLVAEYARLLREGKKLPLGGFAPAPRPEVKPDAPKALIFSPHPDDECVVGALPLRLLREARMNVINVAVTLGSNPSRRAERYRELENACGHVGFGLMPTVKDGLERITVKSRETDKALWTRAVEVITGIIGRAQPRVIFLPHEKDWHPTHVGTHFLVMDALKELPAEFECLVVETEFWGAMQTPNLMVESSARDVTDLVTALSFHVGEVRRDPYHLLLPAWMQDNVRRGAELVGGAGSAAPDFAFATLYRLGRWKHGRLENPFDGGRQISCDENPAELFGVTV
jgi:LmbE family N-acetylglucosaminyl deacetylase